MLNKKCKEIGEQRSRVLFIRQAKKQAIDRVRQLIDAESTLRRPQSAATDGHAVRRQLVLRFSDNWNSRSRSRFLFRTLR